MVICELLKNTLQSHPYRLVVIVSTNFLVNAAHLIKVLTFLTVVKIIFLLGFVVLACVKGNSSNLSRPFENSTLNPDMIAGSFYNTWFAFDGYDIIAVAVEEIKRPQR